MSEDNKQDAAKCTPPLSLRDFPAEVVRRLLLPPLPPNSKARPRALSSAEEWPTDRSGLEYFHRSLVRLLWERGGTADAARSIQNDLESGRIVAVVCDDETGHEFPIEARLWKAA